jgi:predicted ATPase with chaperone activity
MPESMSLLKAAMEDLSLSAQAHDKVVRVARTIADLDGHEEEQYRYNHSFIPPWEADP